VIGEGGEGQSLARVVNDDCLGSYVETPCPARRQISSRCPCFYFTSSLIHHPLEGKKEVAIHSFDLPAMTKLFGTEPVFIFDPVDRSNELCPAYTTMLCSSGRSIRSFFATCSPEHSRRESVIPAMAESVRESGVPPPSACAIPSSTARTVALKTSMTDRRCGTREGILAYAGAAERACNFPFESGSGGTS